MEGLISQVLRNRSSSSAAPVCALPPSSCHFFRLPSELKFEVMGYLDSKRDLYNVSKTCRWLEDIALKRLYCVVDFEIPADKSLAWSTGGYLRLRPHVLNVIQELTIRDGVMDYTKPEFCRRRRSDAGCPETYAAQAVQCIPANQLRSFSFMHRSPITVRLFQLLRQRHDRNLRHLSCYEILATSLPPSALPSNLETLECRSLDKGEAIGRLAHSSKETLQTLRLGAEKNLVKHYYGLRSGYYESVAQPLTEFQSVMSLPEIKNLRRLCLTGLDVAPLVPENIEDALYFTKLEELILESCPSSPALLAALTTLFSFVQSDAAPTPRPVPRLRKFLFRYEVPNGQLRDALVGFLNSFSGLQMLSLLFENWSMSERLPVLIPTHGQTLKQLVIESRIQPRELLRIDTSRPFGVGGYTQQLWEESMDDVCRLCPHLRELSIGFPWNDEMIRLRPSLLPTLPLKTMHIRNFPESNQLAQVGDYSIKEHGIKFLDWTYGNLHGTQAPNLQTLSIGPALYETRFKGANPNRMQTPEFLRTHHFTIDWAKTRFGRWSPMITSVSERYMEEDRGERPLDGIFQQVWLK